MTAFNLTDSIHGIHDRLCAQLRERRNIPHAGTAGDEGELLWLKVLEQHLPRRYAIRRGIVIDSRGARSDAIDLIIYDPQYTPVFLAQDEHAYVFAEAVYAVFEVKTKDIGAQDFTYAANKAASVRRLHRTRGPIFHAGGTYSEPRPPFDIVSGLLALSHTWSRDCATKFEEHGSKFETDEQHRLDLVFCLDGPDRRGSLWQTPVPPLAGEEPAFQRLEHGSATFVLFLYSLIHRLQRLATVPAVIWPEYIRQIRGADTADDE